jgi:hypothetical protein
LSEVTDAQQQYAVIDLLRVQLARMTRQAYLCRLNLSWNGQAGAADFLRFMNGLVGASIAGGGIR